MSKAFQKWWEECGDEPVGNEKYTAQQAWNAAMDRAMEVTKAQEFFTYGGVNINRDLALINIEKEKV